MANICVACVSDIVGMVLVSCVVLMILGLVLVALGTVLVILEMIPAVLGLVLGWVNRALLLRERTLYGFCPDPRGHYLNHLTTIRTLMC